ncbi:MAG: hypothetical protein AB1630_02210 [bacterium]
MPTIKVPLEEVAHILQRLTSGEIETLEIMLTPNLSKEIKERWQDAKKELSKARTITKEDLFEECTQ